MDDSYILTPPDPSVSRAIKWLMALLALRVPKAPQWAAFLALNPTIRRHLSEWIRANSKYKDPETVDRRARKLANFVSVSFLYSAVAGNPRIPKDYLLIYIYMTYYGTLNPPSSRIVVSPTTSHYFKVHSYSQWVRQLYAKKHFIIFPVIFGQILSNYITPTRYKLNQRYLSSSIKLRILDPIWINFLLGVNSQSISWLGLLLSYARHNALLFAFFAATSAKSRLIDHYYEFKHGYRQRGGVRQIVTNYITFVIHKANAMTNFIYGPNLIAMLLLSLTAPLLTRISLVRRVYLGNMKQFVKNYMKVVGFAAAFATLQLNSMQFIPSWGYHLLGKDTVNIRKISTEFLDSLNIYLFRLIVLSKWRITKENHPWFTVLNVGTWQRIELVIMTYGVWKLMNLNDWVKKNNHGSTRKECERLESENFIKAIDRIMS